MPGQNYERDAFILYNKANAPISRTADTDLSLRFTEKLVSTLDGWGFPNSYYHERDARPGGNIFTELTRLVNTSRCIILIITHGFVRDCWSRYSNQHAFKKLLDMNQPHRLIPIAVGLADKDIPESLNVSEPVCFSLNWDVDDDHCRNNWKKLREILVGEGPGQAGDVSGRHIHAEEAGDNVSRSEQGIPVVHDTEPHKIILERCHTDLVEDMDAKLVLDQLVTTQMFRNVSLRDIGQIQIQSDQNRQIIDLIRRNGWPAYEAFKGCLLRAHQDNLLAKLVEEERSMNIHVVGGASGGAGGDGEGPTCVDQRDYPDYRRQSSDLQSTESLDSQQAPASLPSVGPLDHSVDVHSMAQDQLETVYNREMPERVQLETVIADLPGAVSAATQPLDPSEAVHHTTNVSRQVTASVAMISLEADAPQSSLESMSLQTGPKLSCPPPVKKDNQSATLNQSAELNQSVQFNQSAQLNQSFQSSQAAPLNQAAEVNQSAQLSQSIQSKKSEPKQTAQSNPSSQSSQSALSDQSAQSNHDAQSTESTEPNLFIQSVQPTLLQPNLAALPTQTAETKSNSPRDSDTSYERTPEIAAAPLKSTESRSPDSMDRAEGIEQEHRADKVPELLQQMSLSKDEDLVMDHGLQSKETDIGRKHDMSSSTNGILSSESGLALNSLLEDHPSTSSGYSSTMSPEDGVRPMPEGGNADVEHVNSVTSDQTAVKEVAGVDAEDRITDGRTSEARPECGHSLSSVNMREGTRNVEDQPRSIGAWVFGRCLFLMTLTQYMYMAGILIIWAFGAIQTVKTQTSCRVSDMMSD